jgi:hypothetical protein
MSSSQKVIRGKRAPLVLDPKTEFLLKVLAEDFNHEHPDQTIEIDPTSIVARKLNVAVALFKNSLEESLNQSDEVPKTSRRRKNKLTVKLNPVNS